jgi:hypothetical protein
MKPVSMIIIMGVMIFNYLNAALAQDFQNLFNYSTRFYITQVLLLMLLCLWALIITQSWVKTQAFTYAERLIESIDQVKEMEVKK